MDTAEAVRVLRENVAEWEHIEVALRGDKGQRYLEALEALLQAHEAQQEEIGRLREAAEDAASYIGARGDRHGSETAIRLAARLRAALVPQAEGRQEAQS